MFSEHMHVIYHFEGFFKQFIFDVFNSFKANGLIVEWIECLRNYLSLCRLKHTNQTYQLVLINLILTVNLNKYYY